MCEYVQKVRKLTERDYLPKSKHDRKKNEQPPLLLIENDVLAINI